MRTTLDIDDDVLTAAKESGRREKKIAGEVTSELSRRALIAGSEPGLSKVPKHGFRPFARRGTVVTNELIDRLRNKSGS